MTQSLLLQPFVWTLADGTASNDVLAFEAQLAECMARLNWPARVLGQVQLDAPGEEGEPGEANKSNHVLKIWHADDFPGASDHGVRPRRLIAAGFHGEEPAGPWGLLRWLQSGPDLSGVALSLLPLVNRSGFAAGTRLNALAQNPNRGYGAAATAAPSAEGQVLLQHASTLRAAALHGALCCHEDQRTHQVYVYSFEPAAQPGPRSRALLQAAAAFLPVMGDAEVDEHAVKSGVIFNHFDGSFESWMAEQGNAFAACVETPGQCGLEARISAQAAMMAAFVGWA
jgi:predicted deacylase